jgi:predicted RecA/RadA family phage recombinase
MKNFLSSGATITQTSAGAKKSGTPYVAGELVGVAGHDAATNEPVVLHLVGEYQLPKATGQAWAIGAKLYWDAGNAVCTTADGSGANKAIGHATEAAINADAVGTVRLSN